VIWVLFFTAGVGLAIGAFFRVPALLIATAATVAGNVIAHLLSANGPDKSLGHSTIVLLITLQGAYLVGLLLAFVISKLRSRGLVV
jgi:uncharacterized membrane protein YhiD involved in acid resistance